MKGCERALQTSVVGLEQAQRKRFVGDSAVEEVGGWNRTRRGRRLEQAQKKRFVGDSAVEEVSWWV